MIIDFYRRQPTDYADYFYAAWCYQYRDALSSESLTLVDTAKQHAISAAYLKTIWDVLARDSQEVGPLATLLESWQSLPKATTADAELHREVRRQCASMRDYVVETRRQFEPKIDNLRVDGVHKGSQPFVLWKNDQYAAHRRSPNDAVIHEILSRDEHAATDRSQFIASCERFCSVFPDRFYVSERGRDYLDKPREQQEKGRLLSAGFHSMMGYYRDDRPLYDLVLSNQEQRELDELWELLDFFTAAPVRQYQGFLWFDRTDSSFMRDPEFDFARPEDTQSLSEAMIQRLSKVYLAKATRQGGEEVPLQAIRDFFRNTNERIRWVEASRLAAEPHQLDAVIRFANKAYRRPLTSAEESDLRGFYQQLRDTHDLTHEQAIKDVIVSVLMSPHFFYRVDLISDSQAPRALSDVELASRLSYFLWASIPDEELLRLAREKRLHQTEVLVDQARRMLKDERVRGLATEFGGNWLDFRRFEEHNSVDRERFPSFDDQLRAAMFEEPIRFFIDVAKNNRSTLDFLFADRTFVNAKLAKHYGIDELRFEASEWQRVDGVGNHDRGGLLPMAVFLTKNAPGRRTSPVKRGYWVVRHLLGQRIPPPPPDVPDLPKDEAQLGDLTLGQLLAKHREHESCAGCHDKIDPLGIVFEGYGPIGETRDRDLGGRAVEQKAKFPDGSEWDGINGLRQYLLRNRRDDFVQNLHRKLLSYALGRTLALSDESLLDRMSQRAQTDAYRFATLVETIVTSPQFLRKRGHRTATGDADVE